MERRTRAAIRSIGRSLSRAQGPATKPYDRPATVTAVDGQTAWVLVDGSSEPMPVAMTIDCAPGDSVRVHVSSGGATVTGNDTAPPTDDAEAIAAKVKAEIASDAASTAQETATSAQETADAAAERVEEVAATVKNYAWADDEGLHLTLTEGEVVDGEANILVDADSLDVRVGTDVKASYGADDAIIGTGDASQTIIGDGSIMLVNNGSTVFEASGDGVVIGAGGAIIAEFSSSNVSWTVMQTPTMTLQDHPSQPAQVATASCDLVVAEDNMYMVITNDGDSAGTRTAYPVVNRYKSGMVTSQYASAGGYRAVYSIEVGTDMLMDTEITVYVWGTTDDGSKPVAGTFASGYSTLVDLLGDVTIEQLSADSTLNVVGGLTVDGTAVSLEGHTHGYYTKPSGGIPKTDLSSAVQASLDLADSAVQSVDGKVDATSESGSEWASVQNNGGAVIIDAGNDTSGTTLDVGSYGIMIYASDGTDATTVAVEAGGITITSASVSTDAVLVTDTNGMVATSTVTSTELGYLSGVTSSIQAQLDGKVDASSIEVSTANGYIYVMFSVDDNNKLQVRANATTQAVRTKLAGTWSSWRTI